MARTPQDVTGAELNVMKQLWEKKSATVRNLVDVLYPSRTPSDLATVQKLLKRLEAKGFVTRDRSVSPQLMSPKVDCDELIRRRLEQTADVLCDGDLAPLFRNLTKSQRFDNEATEVKEIISSIS